MSIYDQGAAVARLISEPTSSGFVRDWGWFSLKDGESMFLRFLTDVYPDPNAPHLGAWISVMQHNSTLTCPRPEWHSKGESTKERNWPMRMNCVCRNTMVSPGGVKTPLHALLPDSSAYSGCYVCDNRRSEKGGPAPVSGRTWALAAVREQVQLPDGSTTLVTKTQEGTSPSGESVSKPVIVVVNQAYSNFFKQLEGVAEAYGTLTIVDRDFKVTRVGTQLNTSYTIVAMPQVGWKDPSGANVILDLANPDHFAAFDVNVNLDEIVSHQASHDWQRRWFDESFIPPLPEGADSNTAAPEAQQAKPTGDIDAAAMALMADRLTGYGQPAPSQ